MILKRSTYIRKNTTDKKRVRFQHFGFRHSIFQEFAKSNYLSEFQLKCIAFNNYYSTHLSKKNIRRASRKSGPVRSIARLI